MEYKLICEEDIINLEHKLGTYLKDDWEIHEGTFYARDRYHQAIVKYDKENSMDLSDLIKEAAEVFFTHLNKAGG